MQIWADKMIKEEKEKIIVSEMKSKSSQCPIKLNG